MRWLVPALMFLPLGALAEEAETTLPPPSPELLAPRPRTADEPSLHPSIVLRDKTGTPVHLSGAPVSAAKTCDGCHDVGWIKSHDGHGNLTVDEFARPAAMLPGGNCFLCHVRSADNSARAQAIAQGRSEWIETATLVGTNLVSRSGDGWQWRKDQLQADGSVSASALGLGRPGNQACGFCHGAVHQGPAPFQLERSSSHRMTELEGAVFSGQRISDSAMNVADKDGLTRPWDVHAERMLSCAGCHFSPNHPAYVFANRGPEHLQFDARRTAITEYLRRPDHRFAKGPSGTAASRHEGNIRRCESCHDASKAHGFLPRAERHFAALLCESCHVPMAHAPARQEEDWTMLTPAREPRVVYRGLRADGFVPGFRPVLLARPEADGRTKLAPNNVVTTYRWVDKANGKTVSRDILERAFFAGNSHRPELVRVLDGNGDSRLEDAELVLDTEAKVKVARDLLVAAGARAPEMVGEVRAYEIHHGTSLGRFALRDCSACHAEGSRVDAPFVVAATIPFGVTPSFADTAPAADLTLESPGHLVLTPRTTGLHVFGHTRSRLLDGLGILLFAGTLAGAGGHAAMRVRAARRRKKEQA